MRTGTWVKSLAVLLSLLLPIQAAAIEFVFVGTRQIGMGGAGVASTIDATATYWNPAALAMSKKIDIRIQGGGQAVDRGRLLRYLERHQQYQLQ